MKLTDSQIRRALKGAETYTKADGSTFQAHHEYKHTELPTGETTESEFLLCARGTLAQGDIVLINAKKHRVQYIIDDRSGLIDAFISIVGGQHAKYE